MGLCQEGAACPDSLLAGRFPILVSGLSSFLSSWHGLTLWDIGVPQSRSSPHILLLVFSDWDS
jgi:hypothetical protein